MDTPNSRQFRDEDTRDSRTTQGPSPMPVTSRDMESEARPLSPADDPVNAVSPGASPSSYTQRDIEEGNTPIDEELEELVDPGLGPEQLSTNPDVLNLDDRWRVESEEADFMGDPGTVDVIQSVEEGEPYFPPTDPVIRIEPYNDADVLGGFAATSLEEPTEVEDVPGRAQGGDDEIAQRVRYALSTDAYTADLNIEVEVEDGVVYLHGTVGSLDDVEQAEQVAGSVEGVVDVEEDLEIV